MERTRRVLGAGVLMLAGAGILMLAGAGIANARPARTACQNVNATFTNLDTTLTASHASAKTMADTAARELTQAASTGSPALKSAVKTLVTDLQTGVAAGNLDMPKITADDNAITAACVASGDSTTIAPKGDPATGGGSTAGIQDPALFGTGGAAVLAGLGVLGLARRNRPSSPSPRSVITPRTGSPPAPSTAPPATPPSA